MEEVDQDESRHINEDSLDRGSEKPQHMQEQRQNEQLHNVTKNTISQDSQSIENDAYSSVPDIKPSDSPYITNKGQGLGHNLQRPPKSAKIQGVQPRAQTQMEARRMMAVGEEEIEDEEGDEDEVEHRRVSGRDIGVDKPASRPQSVQIKLQEIRQEKDRL